ncbi:urease subunit beta [Acinetobacter sp. ANC 3832]|uniref:urease subunit beta n=1 Tax=Acinetobacter sp. ANC 3832 TaxID=1977874 RepID=UPI000A33C68B|nr:urease subunit beta [Acinetobacter sp. ANC 3832]OTG96252.1 urease subunit beta [Acinetobacter sp. ANC 3832]
MIPGEVITKEGDLEFNVGRESVKIRVDNLGDRPVQIGSHFHFYEANDALQFDREKAKGFRLNIAAGTAIRFEPGQGRNIELVALVGKREVYGFAGRVMGKLDSVESESAESEKNKG